MNIFIFLIVFFGYIQVILSSNPRHSPFVVGNVLTSQNESELPDDEALDTGSKKAASFNKGQSTGENNTEVLAQVGGTATLSCSTNHLSDEMVTWLKREGDELLTVGQQVYSSEFRFSAALSRRSKAWELFIKDVKISDAGQYECQLTTHPPVTFYFILRVSQAKAYVNGPNEVHIEEGSQLALECQVHFATTPPIYIFWYHNGTMVNYERKRDLQVNHENYTSGLVVSRVTRADAGVYTCDPHLATPANVTVHVVTGEKPAAMQHGRNSDESSNCVRTFPSFFALIGSVLACTSASTSFVRLFNH